MATQEGSARVGRPRMDPDRQRELLLVVVELLREVGYEALTMDGVAVRAKCSKATLYRQWRSKGRMVAEALSSREADVIEVPDCGSLRDDLLLLTRRLAALAERDAPLVAALHHAALTDEAISAALRDAVTGFGAAGSARLVERAMRRGELNGSPDVVDFLPVLVFGIVVTRPLFDGTAADEVYLARFVDGVLVPMLRDGHRELRMALP
ncbi:TetR/AcrR family transcriptional regulator [Streptomyces tendae]